MISPATLRQLEQLREEERERERIRRQFARVGRSSSKSGKQSGSGSSKGAGTFRMPPGGRSRRAPATSSQYHFHAKKSKASGAGKAPVSCVNKIKYDLGLDEKDPHKDRVKMVFVVAPKGTPAAARDPLAMAEACCQRARQSKYANSSTGQMMHIDTALPNILSDDQLAQLSDKINQRIGQKFGVPCYSGVHLDKGNYHVHSSIPLYEVQDDGQGGFYLGGRINHAKRPSEREALGLPRSPAAELRELRQEVAALIADSVADHYKDVPNREQQVRHLSERWRHGHLTLPQQVEKAAGRGDVQFVLDNLNRQATIKEGPAREAWSVKHNDRHQAAFEHNKMVGKQSEIPAPELITKTLVQRVVQLAEQAKLDQPEQFRMLARQAGLNIHWVAGKEKDKVQGVAFSIDGGPRVAGGRIGASLGTLQKRLGWAEKPTYRRFPPKEGEEVMDFKQKLIEAKLEHVESEDYVAKSIKVTLFRLKKIEDEARKNAAHGQPATPVKDAPTVPTNGSLASPPKAEPAQRAPTPAPVKKVRSKRKSNDPSYHTGRPKGSNIKAPPAQPAKQEVRQPLTPRQRELLAYAWDDQQARKAGSFDGPLAQSQEQLESTRANLARHMKDEPWPQQEAKRGLFGSRMVETKEHKEWQRDGEKQRQQVSQLEQRIEKMIEQATNDPKLLASLPRLEAQAAQQLEQHQVQARELAQNRYQQAISTLETARPGSPQAQQAHAAIAFAIKTDPSLAEHERERRAQQSRKGHHRPAGQGTSFQRQRPR